MILLSIFSIGTSTLKVLLLGFIKFPVWIIFETISLPNKGTWTITSVPWSMYAMYFSETEASAYILSRLTNLKIWEIPGIKFDPWLENW